MLTASRIKAILFAAAALFAGGLSGSAQAAIVAPFQRDAVTYESKVTPVYWIWRHHHKIWIPSHHHGY